MEISKPLMSPTYLNGLNDERRPESPRSPTKSVIPITPGLQLPTPYGSSYTPSPEPSSAPGSAFSTASTSTFSSAYTPTASYVTSPVTPRRERKEEEAETATPRKRSNSATEKDNEKETQVATSTSRSETRTRPSREGRSKDGVSNPMKSFRVNLDDPCWKVLPAAMKKYDVKGREEDYRLYITYGDIGIPITGLELTLERKLSSNEKPLIIFQQLQKEGRNPLFMLRYAGKSRSEADTRDRDREHNDRGDREHRNGRNAQSKDDDPTTPKLGSTNGSDGHGRYAEGVKTSAGNGMF